ncbi:MAG: UDP-N-acetylglucosamine 2-epimerase [Gammaproteobacteria bacterium GWE2_42_36]|nr:MAG: UDP-N-acetylglucosamine 2-epimerase [Gammaproteobacteria bacterium GWE2_42_36]
MSDYIKIATVIGARPQFIKAAVVSRELKKYKDIQEIIIHTGQHYDWNMSSVFFEEMNIPKPNYFFDINGLNHGAMTGQMLEKIEFVLLKEKPSLVLVYGDTNTTLAGALAAKKHHIKIAHIEAGLRSFNIKMPEEVNRIITDRISDYLFCPTEKAIENLRREGFNSIGAKISNVGDVMYDAVLYYSEFSAKYSSIISRLNLNDFILCTIHRAENVDFKNRLKSIIEALNHISKEKKIVLPLHPRTKNFIKQSNIKLNFEPIDPVGYFDMLELLKHCQLVITDSGGLQKEAYFFDKFCITLRDETEWVELVENGFNQLAGADPDKIIMLYEGALNQKNHFAASLYGDGQSAKKIVKEVML